MNLHYMEYLEGLPESDQLQLMLAWAAHNPPYTQQGSWAGWNAYALSLRALVWMQQLARVAVPPALLIASLAQQLRYLLRHLETDLGGNHLLKNIKTLIWAGAFFKGREAAKWRGVGLRLLRRELKQQFLPDGMHFELSPSYHCQCLGDLIEIRHVLGGNQVPELDGVIERAASVAVNLAHPDGKIAQFGDAGLTMAYAPAMLAEATARVIGVVPPTPSTTMFADAGYTVIRDGQDVVFYDFGKIAPPSLPAHGHGDLFSYEWSVGGERVVVDQGVFEYVAGAKRSLSRASAAHNTLSIEDCEQAEFFGAFRCARQAEVRMHALDINGDSLTVDASHDGFARLFGGPVHRRKAHLTPSRLRFEDSLDRETEREVRVSNLLAPEIAVQQLTPQRLELQGATARATITGSHPLHVEAAVHWPDMGVERVTKRVVMRLPPGATSAWLELEKRD